MNTIVSNQLDNHTRIAINKAIHLLEIFRDADPTMPISEAMTFLACVADPDLTQEKLGARLGFADATTSRLFQALGKFVRKNEPGLEWLDESIDPMNRRRTIRKVTPKGSSVLVSITNVLRSN